MDSKDTPLEQQAKNEAGDITFAEDLENFFTEHIPCECEPEHGITCSWCFDSEKLLKRADRYQQDQATIAALRAEAEALKVAGVHAVTMAERCIDGAHAGQHSFLPGQYKDWKHARFAWNTLTTKTD